MSPMKILDICVAAVLVIGGLNWGLVGLFEFDLVAAISGGLSFGETNFLSRTIYLLVGLAALYQVLGLRAIQHRWGVMFGSPRKLAT